MKSQLLLGLASFFAVVVAQDPATAPPCSYTCIARDTPECLPQDNTCKCKSSNWVSIVSCCISQICVGDYDQAFALAIAQRTCYLQTSLYVSFGSGAQCPASSGANGIQPNTATAYSSLATETLTTTIFTASPTTLSTATLSSSISTSALPSLASGSTAQSTSSTNPNAPAPAGGLPDIVKIALGVGLGVGGSALLLAIFAIWYRVRRSRARKVTWTLPPAYSETKLPETKLPPSYSQTKLAESRDAEVPRVEDEVK